MGFTEKNDGHTVVDMEDKSELEEAFERVNRRFG